MWTVKLQMFNLDLEMAENPEIKLSTSAGSSKKQESSRKTSISALLTMPKHLTVWITITVENSERDGNTRPPDLPSETVRTAHGTTVWFQIGKEVCQSCILSPCLFNLYAEYIMWNARLVEAQAGIKITRILIIISDMQMTPHYGKKWRRTKEPLDESERAELKSWLKTQHSKTKIMASSPITSWQIDEETMETMRNFILGGFKITADGDCSHEIKTHLFLGRKAMTKLDSMRD